MFCGSFFVFVLKFKNGNSFRIFRSMGLSWQPADRWKGGSREGVERYTETFDCSAVICTISCMSLHWFVVQVFLCVCLWRGELTWISSKQYVVSLWVVWRQQGCKALLY